MGISNKTKGWVAGGLGAALLLGTGGTFALWSAEDTVSAGTVRTGVLTVSADDVKWEPGLLVPNGSIEGTFTITPELVGDLEGTLSVDWNEDEVDLGAFDGFIDVDFAFTSATVDPDTDPIDVTVTVSLGKIEDVATGGEPGGTMTEDINLGDFEVSLVQSSPLAPPAP